MLAVITTLVRCGKGGRLHIVDSTHAGHVVCMLQGGMDGSEMRYKSGERYAYCRAAAALASSAAATAGLTFLPSFHRTRGGGARLRRPSRERTRTTDRHMRGILKQIETTLRTMRVDGARDAVCDFDVQLRDGVF